MTSLARELPSQRAPDLEDFRARMARRFCEAYDRTESRVAPEELLTAVHEPTLTPTRKPTGSERDRGLALA
jgi:hypothetical protein